MFSICSSIFGNDFCCSDFMVLSNLRQHSTEINMPRKQCLHNIKCFSNFFTFYLAQYRKGICHSAETLHNTDVQALLFPDCVILLFDLFAMVIKNDSLAFYDNG